MNFGTILSLILIIIIIHIFIGGACLEYGINKWLIHFDKTPKIVLWQGMLLSLVPIFGQTAIPFAIITWIML